MSKLPKEHQFIDLSDYGRFMARWIAKALQNTSVSPIHITTSFILAGLLAIISMLYQYYVLAALLLILKSVLDAADGELARLKKRPSYVGRYYDSIADIFLNLMFLLTFWYITDGSIYYVILAFIGIQLQGTLYNYYYVILRNSVNGDITSRIFEDHPPKAYAGENQNTVNKFYKVYDLCYITFDKSIYHLDRSAVHSEPFPAWFMTLLSTFGLGFQLLIMSVMLMLDLESYVIPFFIYFSVFILVFVAIRKWLLNKL